MAFILSLFFLMSLLFIVYTYFGYPIIIGLWAGMKQNPAWSDDYIPLVTVLIAAYNEEKVIQKKIENTLALDYPKEKLQIIVAADGSSDQTALIVNNFVDQGVLLNFTPERGGKMAAIIRAMQFAVGDIVIFSDANNIYDAAAIKKLVSPFSDPAIGAAIGSKLIVEDGRELSSAEGLYWKYDSWIKKSETTIGSCVTAVGEIFAIRRVLFNAPKANIINDDQYMIFDLLRRGHRAVYVPEARSYEYVSKSASDEQIRRSRMTVGAIQTISISASLLPLNHPMVIWQIVSHKYFRIFIPYAMLLALLSNIALMIIRFQTQMVLPLFLETPVAQIFLMLQIVFYGMALLGNLIHFNGILGKLFYLPTFLVNSNLALVMGMYNFFTKKQAHLWNRVQR